jgi:hypothetical protein
MKKTICIARLRSRVKYVKPLEHICDSFYECLKQFVKNNESEYNFTYYNFGFDKHNPRNPSEIEKADIIIIPSEAEFTYHTPGLVHTLDLKKSNDSVKLVESFVNNKQIILLRSDRRDDKELYEKYTFPDIKIGKFDIIDEIDFKGNIHAMKYYFITENKPSVLFEEDVTRNLDFCYWGSDKRKGVDGKDSGDVRHDILFDIFKNINIHSYFIGKFNRFTPQQKFDINFGNIVPYLKKSKSTLCFNWMDENATTSRYAESIATGMIPFVWKKYDATNTLVKTKWQRIDSSEQFCNTISSMNYSEKYEEVKLNFLDSILPKQEYITLFEEKLKKLL